MAGSVSARFCVMRLRTCAEAVIAAVIVKRAANITRVENERSDVLGITRSPVDFAAV